MVSEAISLAPLSPTAGRLHLGLAGPPCQRSGTIMAAWWPTDCLVSAFGVGMPVSPRAFHYCGCLRCCLPTRYELSIQQDPHQCSLAPVETLLSLRPGKHSTSACTLHQSCCLFLAPCLTLLALFVIKGRNRSIAPGTTESDMTHPFELDHIDLVIHEQPVSDSPRRLDSMVLVVVAYLKNVDGSCPQQRILLTFQ